MLKNCDSSESGKGIRIILLYAKKIKRINENLSASCNEDKSAHNKVRSSEVNNFNKEIVEGNFAIVIN